jgi:drug/metabolite transporter (DMT)-like permease
LNLFRISNFEIWYVCNGDHGAEFLVGSVDVNQRDNAPFNPSLALISGILAVSTGAIFARLAEAPALVIAAYRVGLASLILAPIAWWQVRDELLGLEKKEYLLAGLAGLFLACHFGTWISSLNYTSVANSVVLVNTNPIWVGVLTPLISKDRLSWMTRIGIVISVIGGVIIGFGDFAIGRQALWGDFLALLGSVCAAMYLLGTYSAFVGMAVISQIIGHSSYNWALKWFSASLIAVSLLGEPIGATILAYIIFGETLTWTKFVGGTLILAAIYLAGRGEQD